MSNVLIGIIGVILFIGLALAGALILGDDFRSSSNDTKAAAVISQLHQMSNAVDMYEMKTGTQFQAGAALSSLMPRFLKSIPNDPTGTSSFAVWSDTGLGGGAPAGMIVLPMSRNAEAVCLAIVQQASGLTTYVQASSVPQLPTQPVGCFRATANVNSFVNQTFYAYVRT